MEIRKRAFVSFDGHCPYNCKHCFSFEIDQPDIPRTIKQIVDSLSDTQFDIVYVSQKKENFVNVDNGLLLCEQLFSQYECNLMIITRNVFNQHQISRLQSLQQKMRKREKFLFVGISIIGLESAAISEDLSIVPAPEERLEFASTLYRNGIPSIVLIRPLFPRHIIPTEECMKIVDKIAGNISCILSGPLMVNKQILERLGMTSSDLTYLCDANSEYLDGAIAGSMKNIDVTQETEELKKYCQKKGVPYFAHSLPAINYIVQSLSTSV